MARIRTIKPEFWTSEQVVECSPTSRLLFIGIWNFCDDFGNHPSSVKQIKMEIFPGDDISIEEIGKYIRELINNDLLIEYQGNDNKKYLHVTGWHHQKIDKKSQKYPKFDDHSTTIPQPFDDHSTTGSLRKGKEGEGKEGSGGGKEGSENSHADFETPPPPPTFEEFSEFAKAHKPLIRTHINSELMNRYKTWSEMNWVDKDGNSIAKYWKAKLVATLPYIEKDDLKFQNYPKRQRLN